MLFYILVIWSESLRTDDDISLSSIIFSIRMILWIHSYKEPYEFNNAIWMECKRQTKNGVNEHCTGVKGTTIYFIQTILNGIVFWSGHSMLNQKGLNRKCIYFLGYTYVCFRFSDFIRRSFHYYYYWCENANANERTNKLQTNRKIYFFVWNSIYVATMIYIFFHFLFIALSPSAIMKECQMDILLLYIVQL